MNDNLVIRNLNKQIGDLHILSEIDMVIHPNKTTAIIGPNGAGKTSLFNAIFGAMKVDSGRVLVGNNEITNLPPWKVAQAGIGRLFQDVRIFPNLSAKQNILAALHRTTDKQPWQVFAGKGRRRLRNWDVYAQNLVDRLGIEGELDNAASHLSFGNQKLLAIARLIAGQFRILLLDEPSAGISPAIAENLTTIIKELTNVEGKCVVVIEHNINFIKSTSDNIYVMNDGKIFDFGSTEEVLLRSKVKELCLGLGD